LINSHRILKPEVRAALQLTDLLTASLRSENNLESLIDS
jgi:hypothetical protein